MEGSSEVAVKPTTRRDPEFAMTPETAVWLLYAGLVQGIRWRRHLASHPSPSTATSRQRLPGPAPR